MLVSDVIEEVKTVLGQCKTEGALLAITRGVQLLANKRLVDPLVGYFDFSLSGSYFVALPREVKTVLRVNINKNPTFGRARLFEFNLNTEGTVDEAEPGYSWSDRGYLPIQDEKKLPGKLKYKASNAADNGKTCTVEGLDEDGRTQTETLTANSTAPTEGAIEFHKVLRVQREVTTYECFLWCNGSNIIAQYYGDETEPEYRVIKLSKNPAAVRVMFRRHVFAVTSLDSFIPMHSHMAVIHAAKAVRFFEQDEYDKGQAALTMAESFLKEEQDAREEHSAMSQGLEIQSATDNVINVADGIIVSDIYDAASDIFGPIGRRKLFDKLTTAIEVLGNKGNWDARVGVVDIYTIDNTDAVTYSDSKGHGLFVLPRWVETPLAVSRSCGPMLPRNRWFEFHLNGTGGGDFASCSTWDDCGEVCLMRPLPLDADDDKTIRRFKPTLVVAVPDSSADDETEVKIYGLERLSDGRDVEVFRNGTPGWVCPCVYGELDPGASPPRFTRIDRVTKAESAGFIKLYALLAEAATTAAAGIVATVTDAKHFAVTYAGTTAPFEAGDEITVDGLDATVDTVTGTQDTWTVAATADVAAVAADVVLRKIAPAYEADLELGYWYPDELEPKYRMIRVAWANTKRIRVIYRKRSAKVASLYEPVHLRSRLAIELMLRALKAQETDPAAAQGYEAEALRYLREARINDANSDAGSLQFDENSMPGFTGNIQ